MTQSEQINEIAAALSKAQSAIQGVRATSDNPFFKSKYADLASCLDAVRKPFADNGLSVVQTNEPSDSGNVVLVTTLCHSSGQWFKGVLTLTPDKKTPQAIGAAMTYARRYALAAIAGLAQVDDDGEAATVHDPTSERRTSAAKLKAAAKLGSAEFDRAWLSLPEDHQKFLDKSQREWLDTLIDEAKAVDNG